MSKALRYLSVSHKTASVKEREKFYIADNEKEAVMAQICKAFPDISGVLLLVTCNRTEVYFEADTTSSDSLLLFLVSHLLEEKVSDYKHLFQYSESTETTVKHLLDVSSGLVSKVLGDAEIINQLKKAYQIAIAGKLQGSLLERAMQTVFKTHKRIHNETQFRDGTTSVAYKSLKMISDIYGREDSKKKKILFIGAGDIVKQLYKYNAKFGFESIHISNRTKKSAIVLTNRYLGEWFEWDMVLANDFGDVDVIVSAASNCPRLITQIKENSKPKLLIDLALPGNIDPALATQENITFYDIDGISKELEDNKEKRLEAVQQVRTIKKEELNQFNKWHQEWPLRALLANYKITLNQKIKKSLKAQSEPFDKARIKLISNRVIRNIVKYPDLKIESEKIDILIAQHSKS